MLVAGVIEHKIHEYRSPAACARSRNRRSRRAVPRSGVYVPKIGHVVSVVTERARIDRRSQIAPTPRSQIVEFLGEPVQVPDPIAVRVVEHGREPRRGPDRYTTLPSVSASAFDERPDALDVVRASASSALGR